MDTLASPTLAVFREPDPTDEDAQGQTIVIPQKPDEPTLVTLTADDDGGVTVDLNPKIPGQKSLGDAKFYDNLAENIDDTALGVLANDLLQGIEDDEQSRQDWLEDRAEGIKLLALKIEKPSSGSGGASAGVDNTSRSRHPMLLEAALRFQANARSELLPTDGPVKVENADGSNTLEGDDLAQCLEDDMNYYMSVTASEYYPDTDRMLLWTAVGGSGFKKGVYVSASAAPRLRERGRGGPLRVQRGDGPSQCRSRDVYDPHAAIRYEADAALEGVSAG